MAQQHINLGTPPNGADGDTNRTAWGKTEANFNELFARPLAIGKNRVINGAFDFWQRGTASGAPVAGAYYLADRWGRSGVVSQTAASRQAFSPGQTEVPGNPAYYHRVQVVSVANAGAAANMSQPIEDVRTFAGETCTLSFYAKADSAKQIYLEMYQVFGTGGSPVVILPGQKVNLTATWQKFTFTFDVPSIAGKTVGPNSSLNVGFWFDAGSSFNARTNNLGQQSGLFDIAQVQVEAGPVATTFEQRPPDIELSLCQRYYEKSFLLATPPAVNSSPTFASGMVEYRAFIGGAATISLYMRFNTRKRAAAAVTIYNPSANNNEIRNAAVPGDCTGTTPVASESSFVVYAIQPAASGVGQAYWFHWSADAEL